MASTLDISPALGHGILTAQGQSGGYDAIDDRRQWSVGRQEGAVNAAAYKVTQKSEGANLSVDVASNGGHYLVQGDDVDWQGLYLIPATALKANLTLADPPDPTNPRVDQIVLEARDDAHTSDGITRGRLYVLSGTPTAGASVVDSAAYESSKAALPDSTARLAEFVVAANATSIVTANIRDRRTWALGAMWSEKGDNTSVMSSTATAFPGTAIMSKRIECSGAPLRIQFSGRVWNLSAGKTSGVILYADGTSFLNEAQVSSVAASEADTIALETIWTPPPGSHVLEVRLLTAVSGTATVGNSSGICPSFAVEEIIRPVAGNG